MHDYSIKERARTLRLNGRSYNEINQQLKVAKSTLYSWLFELQLPQEARQRLNKRQREASILALTKRNKLQTHKAIQRAAYNRREGKNSISQLSRQELLIAGATLYWGEGYKRLKIKNGRRLTDHPVSLSNSDPDLVHIFIDFLQVCFSVKKEKIIIDLHLYEHINRQAAINFWQEVTKLPQKNFKNIYYGVSISTQRRRKYNRLPYGTAQVRVNSTPLYHKIMGLIDGIKSSAQKINN